MKYCYIYYLMNVHFIVMFRPCLVEILCILLCIVFEHLSESCKLHLCSCQSVGVFSLIIIITLSVNTMIILAMDLINLSGINIPMKNDTRKQMTARINISIYTYIYIMEISVHFHLTMSFLTRQEDLISLQIPCIRNPLLLVRRYWQCEFRVMLITFNRYYTTT